MDPTEWHVVPSNIDTDLRAASRSIGSNSWLVVGASGLVLRVSGTAAREPTPLTEDLRTVSEGPLGTFMGGEDGIVERLRL
jgi:hypothetical protein